MSKKALIVSPYLGHLGGGERYMLTAAEAIGRAGYHLTFAWDSDREITRLATQFGLKLSAFALSSKLQQLYFAHSPLASWQATRGFDLVLYMSDGSIPLLGGKRNILHMQVPYHNVAGRSLANRLKLTRIEHVLVNSRFTKQVVDQEYGLDSEVVYPPITAVTSLHKDNLILSVGRFEPSLNVKHQDVLIEAFRLLSPSLPAWRLVLAGASSDEPHLAKLKQAAASLPIEFVTDGSFAKIQALYSQARIYWHAAGYGVDESHTPELTEHFGISVAEAVLAGCIPLVVGKGGVREIVESEEYYWESPKELAELTLAAASGRLQAPKLPGVIASANFTSSIQRLC